MKLALFLTPLLTLISLASSPDFPTNLLDGGEGNGTTPGTRADRITAIYTNADWHSPSFAPQLLAFRDKYATQLELVLLPRDRPEQSRKHREPELLAPTMAPEKKTGNQPLWDALRGSGIGQLLIFGPGGDLITRDGRALLEKKQEPGKPRTWGNKKASGYQEWEQMLLDWHHLGSAPEITPQEYFQRLQIKHGSSAFWPVYLALIRKPTPDRREENATPLSTADLRKLMENAAATVVQARDWDALWRAAELLSEGNLEDGGPHHRADRLATHFFHTVGALAAGDASFAESCTRAPKGNPAVQSAMLRALSAAAATGTHYLDEALFWLEARDYVSTKKNYRILEPLLLSGNPRAYAMMAEAARKKALYHVVKAPLETAAEAGRREPLAILGQMELQYIQ